MVTLIIRIILSLIHIMIMIVILSCTFRMIILILMRIRIIRTTVLNFTVKYFIIIILVPDIIIILIIVLISLLIRVAYRICVRAIIHRIIRIRVFGVSCIAISAQLAPRSTRPLAPCHDYSCVSDYVGSLSRNICVRCPTFSDSVERRDDGRTVEEDEVETTAAALEAMPAEVSTTAAHEPEASPAFAASPLVGDAAPAKKADISKGVVEQVVQGLLPSAARRDALAPQRLFWEQAEVLQTPAGICEHRQVWPSPGLIWPSLGRLR